MSTFKLTILIALLTCGIDSFLQKQKEFTYIKYDITSNQLVYKTVDYKNHK